MLGFKRGRYQWSREQNQRHLCVELRVAVLVAAVRANAAVEEHGLYRKVAVEDIRG